jgi:hypothetical protein
VLASYFEENGYGATRILRDHHGPWAVVSVTVLDVRLMRYEPVRRQREGDEPGHVEVAGIRSKPAARLRKKAVWVVCPTLDELNDWRVANGYTRFG